MMTTAAQCRTHATNAQELARQAIHELDRAMWRRIAERWLALAHEYETIAERPLTATIH